jgi:hypothetical protein
MFEIVDRSPVFLPEKAALLRSEQQETPPAILNRYESPLLAIIAMSALGKMCSRCNEL